MTLGVSTCFWRQSAALAKPHPFLVAAGTSQPNPLPLVVFEVRGQYLKVPHRSSSVFSFPCGPRTSQGEKRPRWRTGVCRRAQEGRGDHLSAAQKQRRDEQTSGSWKLSYLTRNSSESRGPVKVREPLGSWQPWS